jgi:pyruvate kinase
MRKQTVRRAKIVATIGPASWDEPVLAELLRAGVNIVRVNAAHNTPEERREIVARVRRVAARAGRHVGILQDLAGWKPRTGPLAGEEPIRLSRGEHVEIEPGGQPLLPSRISIEDESLTEQLEPGDRVLIADGLLELVVEHRESQRLQARVARGGLLLGRQGVAVPGLRGRPFTLSDRDRADIAFAAEHDLEYLGVSFVTRADDLEAVRSELRRHGGRAHLVAKIERPEALERIDEIVRVAEAIMVARGDLGVQLQPEEVPVAQKRIIAAARACGRPVIIATQMLESMVNQPIPTRAEVTDVANAVLEGTDALMLSAETATGQYPVEAVAMMDRIITTTERSFPPAPPLESEAPTTIASTIARAATDIARRWEAVQLIGAVTRTGFTAREVARERPETPVIALTVDAYVARQLALVWGVYPLVAPFAESTEELIDGLARTILDSGYAEPGDHVVFTGSLHYFPEPGHTDTLHLRRL